MSNNLNFLSTLVYLIMVLDGINQLMEESMVDIYVMGSGFKNYEYGVLDENSLESLPPHPVHGSVVVKLP